MKYIVQDDSCSRTFLFNVLDALYCCAIFQLQVLGFLNFGIQESKDFLLVYILGL